MWPPADQQDESTDSHLYRAGEEEQWRWFARDVQGWLVGIVGARPRRILDVGCSTGVMVETFASLGWRASGVDADARAVEYGRRRGRDLHVGKIETMPGPFDVIMANHVFEHFANPRHFLIEARERLAQEGLLYLITPTADSFSRWWDGPRWGGWGPRQHEWIFSAAGIRRLLMESGYSCEVVRQRVHRGWPGPGWWRRPFWWKRLPLVVLMRLSGFVGWADGLYAVARRAG